jgi:acyl carrier protein
VTIATGRVVTADDLRATGGSLDDAGVNSIGYINLLEALEQRYGLIVDPETDPHHLRSVDSIAHLVRTALA